MKELSLNIRELHNDNPRATIRIAGDANLHNVDWETDVISENKNPLQVYWNAYNNYVKDIVTSNGNPKNLYTFIKGKRCDNSGVAPPKIDCVQANDPQKKATILNEQFSSIYTTNDSTNIPSMSGEPSLGMHQFSIDQAGIQKTLQGLNPHKAAGPDSIPTHHGTTQRPTSRSSAITGKLNVKMLIKKFEGQTLKEDNTTYLAEELGNQERNSQASGISAGNRLPEESPDDKVDRAEG
ncbi:hypothetical protein LSAT2_027948 [Lamellibrachia satsuma]|nr:hypothetical protein LSAT2_027948 [Lamellibrachia satsuma]